MVFIFRKSTEEGSAECVAAGIAAEEIGRGDLNLTYAVTLNALVSEIISTHSSEELKKEWLPEIAIGEKIVGIAITEPDAGTDAAGIRTTAVHKGKNYILNGEKSGSVWPRLLMLLSFLRKLILNRAVKASVFLSFLLDLPGVECKGYEDMGNVPIGRGSIYFSDVEVSESNLIGIENKGFVQVMNGFDLSRLLIGLQCVEQLCKV